MRVGARILKTGIALILALLVCQWFDLKPPVIAAIAATLSIEPTVYRTLKSLKEQMEANLIGAILGITATYFLGAEPLVVGIVVMLVIIINLRLKLESSLVLSVVTVIAVMETTEGSYLYFAGNRFLLTVIGVFSAAVVNALFIPPHYERRLFKEISETGEKFSILMRTLIHNQMEEKVFREEKDKIKSNFKTMDQLYDLYTEEVTKLRKFTYSGQKKRVIFKQMMTVLHKEMDMLRTFERHIYSSFQPGHHLFPLIQSQLEALTEYHKNILLTYDGILKPREDWHLPDEILRENNQLLHSFMTLYPEVKDTPDPKDDGQWRHLFPVVAEILEYANQLERLSKLVHTFHNHQGEEE
jgi:uncharacterized membrane protein YgaE (UPF0421/DUF939 family)